MRCTGQQRSQPAECTGISIQTSSRSRGPCNSTGPLGVPVKSGLKAPSSFGFLKTQAERALRPVRFKVEGDSQGEAGNSGGLQPVLSSLCFIAWVLVARVLQAGKWG
jgi:hypothetical protein